MMASKNAFVPVAQVTKDGGQNVDPSSSVSAVADYCNTPNGQMLMQATVHFVEFGSTVPVASFDSRCAL